MPAVRIKRGTRAQIESAKTHGELAAGEPYLITDENRLAVGIAPNAYAAMAKEGEGGGSGGSLAFVDII